jgi:hypothetical protein
LVRKGYAFANEAWRSWAQAQVQLEAAILQVVQTVVEAHADSQQGLGLKMAAQPATGDTKAFDGQEVHWLANVPRLWACADVVAAGSSVARAGGVIAMRSPWTQYGPRWVLPGHYLLESEVQYLTVERTGRALVLFENPYVMWHWMKVGQEWPVTFACLHGYEFVSKRDTALTLWLRAVYACAPGLPSLICCDPNPDGLKLATHAHRLAADLRGHPVFGMMDGDILERLEHLVRAPDKLRPLAGELAEILHPHLKALAGAMRQRQGMGEQEALVCDPGLNLLAVLRAKGML